MKQAILVCTAAIVAMLLAMQVFAEEGIPQSAQQSPLDTGPAFTETQQITAPQPEIIQTATIQTATIVTDTASMTTETVITTVTVVTTTAVSQVQVITDSVPAVQLAITETVAPARVMFTLDDGLALDPFLVSVQAGGPLSTVGLATGCTGYVGTAPSLSVVWNGTTQFLTAFFYSDGDAVLLIQAPTGQIFCNDDTNDALLDPTIRIEAPPLGTYHIWVGSHDRNQLIPGLLALTRNSAVNIGTFRPANLAQRAPIPEFVVEPALIRATALPTATTRLAEVGVPTLQPGFAPVNIPVSVNGTVPAFDLPIRGAVCPGFINNYIDFSFTWTGVTPNLRIFFEGDGDAGLLVVGPGDIVYCNDDLAGADNLNPMVNIVNPPTGNFLVYVARLNPEVPVSGMLTVIESTEQLPAILTANP